MTATGFGSEDSGERVNDAVASNYVEKDILRLYISSTMAAGEKEGPSCKARARVEVGDFGESGVCIVCRKIFAYGNIQ